jgi:hypothetical protein
MMLAEPKLAGIWDAFTCPYRAFAIEGGVYGLLMDDLSSELYEGDVAFVTADEDAVLRAMADLHARYWNSDALRLPWLQTAWRRMFFIGPHDQTAPERREQRVRYWPDPLPLLPQSVAELLTMPTDALAERCFGLPWTLFHGDLKGHNVAVLPQGRVAAVDWGLLGAGPPTLDLGWYLFVNWRKHARPKAEILARYRHFLKAARGEELSDAIWTRLVEVGLLCGAIMNTCHLLRDIVNRVPGATGEWDWRIAQLERLI